MFLRENRTAFSDQQMVILQGELHGGFLRNGGIPKSSKIIYFSIEMALSKNGVPLQMTMLMAIDHDKAISYNHIITDYMISVRDGSTTEKKQHISVGEHPFTGEIAKLMFARVPGF